jgi:hypothetical protein
VQQQKNSATIQTQPPAGGPVPEYDGAVDQFGFPIAGDALIRIRVQGPEERASHLSAG